MLQIRHRQHQRGRGIGARDRGHDAARLLERRARAAMLARHDLRDQPGAMQPREVLLREAAVDIVAGGVGREFGRETLEQRGDAYIVGRQVAQRRLWRLWRLWQ